jgi:hypothetical protein
MQRGAGMQKIQHGHLPLQLAHENRCHIAEDAVEGCVRTASHSL